MSQLFADDAYRVMKAFERMPDRVEISYPMRVREYRIEYDGKSPAFAVYENTNRTNRKGHYIFEKKKIIFRRPE